MYPILVELTAGLSRIKNISPYLRLFGEGTQQRVCAISISNLQTYSHKRKNEVDIGRAQKLALLT